MKKFVLSLLVIGTLGLLAQPVWADKDLDAIVKAFSQKASVIAAMKAFSDAFGKVRAENGLESVDDLKKDVFSYYDGDFAKEYKSTVGKDSDLTAAKSVDNDAVALQYYYISHSSEKTGKKQNLVAAQDKSNWTKLHAKHHEMFKSFAEDKENGFYDVFLIDLSGRIVYSVFKEIDFATRLDGGPYASSGLGTMFKDLKDAGKGEVKTGKNAPYFPSYEDNAQFVGTSIYEGDKKIGILVIQLPSW